MNKTVEQLRAELAALESRKKSNAAAGATARTERQRGRDVPMTPEERQEHSDDIFRMALAGPPYIDRFGVEHFVATESNRAPELTPAPVTEPEPVTPKAQANSDRHRFDKYFDSVLAKLNAEAARDE